MYERATSRSARTNGSVEGWHNAFSSGINCSHPNIKLLSTRTVVTRSNTSKMGDRGNSKRCQNLANAEMKE